MCRAVLCWLQGLRWLVGVCEKGLNGILADDMGLGKTVQVSGFSRVVSSQTNYAPTPSMRSRFDSRKTLVCLLQCTLSLAHVCGEPCCRNRAWAVQGLELWR